MNTQNPLVTIIIASYNGDIAPTLQSVAWQDYPNIQLIIADDASDSFDETIVRSIITGTNVKDLIIHRNRKNLGTVKSLNGVLKFVRGEYLELLGQSDCLAHEHVISEYVDLICKKKCDIICANCCYLESSKNVWSTLFVKKMQGMNHKQLYMEMLIHCFILAPAVFIRSRIYLKELLDERFVLCEDWPKWLDLISDEYNFCFTDKVMVLYSQAGVSLQGNNAKSETLFHNDIEKIYNEIVMPQCKCLNFFRQRELMYYFIKRVTWKKLSRLTKVKVVIQYFDVIVFVVIIKNRIMKLCCR